ncbi:MAG: hypothetical protein ACHQ4H_17670, partial [Ktedonobacterales bacterium]
VAVVRGEEADVARRGRGRGDDMYAWRAAWERALPGLPARLIAALPPLGALMRWTVAETAEGDALRRWLDAREATSEALHRLLGG